MFPTVTNVKHPRENQSAATSSNINVMSAMKQENDEEDDKINKESVIGEEESGFV